MATNIIALRSEKTLNLRAVITDRQKDLEQLLLSQADAILVACDTQDNTHAHGWLSLWWTSTPAYQHYQTACIGNYYAPTLEIAQQLLKHAENFLREQNVQYIIAPMDGDTWHNYRLTAEVLTQTSFFLDRITPLEWNEHFTLAGFDSIARYVSTSTEQLDYEEKQAPQWDHLFATNPAYKLQPFNVEEHEDQLQDVYTLSLEGFKNNFLYTDITRDEFMALYTPILPLIHPELIQMAYIDNQLAGFAFAIPDYAQKARGESVDTVILKTVVRAPTPKCKGLGAYLIWNAHQIAIKQGYKRLIAAFMHESNTSLHLTLKTGQIIKKYALYGKQL